MWASKWERQAACPGRTKVGHFPDAIIFVADLPTIPYRYYAQTPSHAYPPEVHDHNSRFTKALDAIKRRHDPTVTTVAQGVLEWQRAKGVKSGMGVGLPAYGSSGGEVQAWLDRFYMSRIGIRFLIGQREFFTPRILFA
jgi:hypothetical protein